MKISILKVINDILEKRFHAILESGSFPECRFENTGHFRSYSLFEYSETWARFAKVVDTIMKNRKLDERLGVFTRKHSASMLSEIQKIVESITEEDIRNEGTRFKTMWDEMTGKDPERPMWDSGEFVACDFCNEGEDTFGGVVIGTYSICGNCAEKVNHPEEIDRYFPKEKTFRQNVIEYRKEIYGYSDAKIEVF